MQAPRKCTAVYSGVKLDLLTYGNKLNINKIEQNFFRTINVTAMACRGIARGGA